MTSTLLNRLISFTTFYIIPSVEGVLSVCLNDSAPWNKKIDMPYLIKKKDKKKHLNIFITRTKKALRMSFDI